MHKLAQEVNLSGTRVGYELESARNKCQRMHDAVYITACVAAFFCSYLDVTVILNQLYLHQHHSDVQCCYLCATTI